MWYSDDGQADQAEAVAIAPGRAHGSLDGIADSERRGLRPIGTTAREVATRTGALLADLLAFPYVWTFLGVGLAGADAQAIPHAISAGPHLILVESVAWPPGNYVMSADGRIHCDGVYIGQSASALARAVRCWQRILPPDHQVRAVIVVHRAIDGAMDLPAPNEDLSWVLAEEASRHIRAGLRDCGPSPSRAALLVLARATLR